MREYKSIKLLGDNKAGNASQTYGSQLHIAKNFVLQKTGVNLHISFYKEGTVNGDISSIGVVSLTQSAQELYGYRGGFLIKETTDFFYYMLGKNADRTLRLEKVSKVDGSRTILGESILPAIGTATNASYGSEAQNISYFDAMTWTTTTIVTPTHILIPYSGYALGTGHQTRNNRILFYSISYTLDEVNDTITFGTSIFQQNYTFTFDMFDKNTRIKQDTDDSFVYAYTSGTSIKVGRVVINSSGGLSQLWEHTVNYQYQGGIIDMNFINNHYFVTDTVLSGYESGDDIVSKTLAGFKVDSTISPTVYTDIPFIGLSSPGDNLQSHMSNWDARRKYFFITPLISSGDIYLNISQDVIKVGTSFVTTTNGNRGNSVELFRYGDNVVMGTIYYYSGSNVSLYCSLFSSTSVKLNGIYTVSSKYKLENELEGYGTTYKVILVNKVIPSDSYFEIWVRKNEDDATFTIVDEDTVIEDIHNSLMVEVRAFPSSDNLEMPTLDDIKVNKIS